MNEYIEREALYEKAYWHGEHPDVGNPFPDGVDAIDIKDVDAIPAADVAPIRHGRWIVKHKHRGGFRRYTGIDDMGEQHTITADERVEYDDRYCSECGKQSADNFLNYCPNCGTKMDLEG